MIIKKIGQFLKKYAFYVAIGVVSVGALAAIFLVPGRDGNVKEEPNPYAKNEEAVGRVVDDITDDTSDVVGQYEEPGSEVPQGNTASQDAAPQENSTGAEQVKDEQIVAETFESTTANAKAEPFFAEGDTFVWPVSGQVIVPYTDESTKHWFSEALNQTMRTFGICIAATEGEEVKAVADGKVIDILDDSSTMDSGIPYVGKTVIIDHGNGYKSLYGFQNGSPDKNLLGKVVRAGEVIGTAGSPTGAFIQQGENIYLQAMHNEAVVDPLKLLDYKQEASSTGAEGVDMGHTPDDAQ
ncbi:MAG: family metallopeptidase [Clostridia bacterium]|jgi:murein DD-endopeptidase MepM/ murein hydrolase activator NlpD|nr:family metallopeptidase [Clostridia bacterium]